MIKTHNKLVRDLIPSIIEESNRKANVRVLTEDEYIKALEDKLLEEYKEVLLTTTRKERIEELADMLEVINSLAKIEGKSIEDVMRVAKDKKQQKGGFEGRIYLESVEDDE